VAGLDQVRHLGAGGSRDNQNDPGDASSLEQRHTSSGRSPRTPRGISGSGTFYGGLNKFSPSNQGRSDGSATTLLTRAALPSGPFVQSARHGQRRDSLDWDIRRAGLSRMDPETERFESFTPAEQRKLPNNVIYGVIEDKKGRIWASSNMGSDSALNPRAGEFLTLRRPNDGLQSREFNGQGVLPERVQESCCSGGIEGFNAFDPDRICR